MILYHGSPEKIAKIEQNDPASDWIFGGLFAACDQEVARSHGKIIHQIEPRNPLTDFELNYQIDGAWDAAVELCGGSEDMAERIMQADCPQDSDDVPVEDIGEYGRRLQALRGELAAKLGFDAVEMQDEHGTTWLCLPGCKISAINA